MFNNIKRKVYGFAAETDGEPRRKIMRIEQKFVDIAVEYTEKEARKNSVIFNFGDINEFRRTLKGIAEISKYTEGQEMHKNDIEAISAAMNKVFDGVAQNFDKLDDAFKSKTNLSNYSAAAYQYLFALTMKELNCPEVPEYAFYGPMSAFARNVSKRKNHDEKISVEDTYKKQRRTNAKDIIRYHSVDSMMKKINDGLDRPEDLGELYAEYRALTIRQENHTGIWRFFHRGENEERTNLLKEMETALKKRIPEEMLAAKPSAEEIRQYGDWLKTKTFIPQWLSSFNISTESHFGYYDYKKNPEMYEAWKLEFEKNKEKPLSEQIAGDLQEKTVATTEKIRNEPVISAPAKSMD